MKLSQPCALRIGQKLYSNCKMRSSRMYRIPIKTRLVVIRYFRGWAGNVDISTDYRIHGGPWRALAVLGERRKSGPSSSFHLKFSTLSFEKPVPMGPVQAEKSCFPAGLSTHFSLTDPAKLVLLYFCPGPKASSHYGGPRVAAS